MENYTRIIGATSTHKRTPTVAEINQGNETLTPFDGAKNNGYFNEMSLQIGNISEELTNLITAQGLTPDGTLTQVEEAISLAISNEVSESTTTTQGISYLSKPITISNGTDADHDIDFTAGNFNFNDGSGQATLAAATGELDATFGTGNGMLDTGTIAIDETYHLFPVYNPTTGLSKPLASLSKTAPTMTLPDADGYTVLGERIAASLTDGSANIRAGIYTVSKSGYEFEYTTPITILNNGSFSSSWVDLPAQALASSKVKLSVYLSAAPNDTTVEILFRNLNINNSYIAIAGRDQNGYNDINANVQEINLDSSGEFAYSSNVSSSGLTINTIGWSEKY